MQININPSKWDPRFLEMAKLVASWSKVTSTQVGAVIIRPDKTVASVGFNGFARGMFDNPDDYNSRPLKYSKVLHAEMNALLFCKEPMFGYSMYVWPFLCCDRCAVHMIQAGIFRVVAPKFNMSLRPEWQGSWDRAQEYLHEASVDVRFV